MSENALRARIKVMAYLTKPKAPIFEVYTTEKDDISPTCLKFLSVQEVLEMSWAFARPHALKGAFGLKPISVILDGQSIIPLKSLEWE